MATNNTTALDSKVIRKPIVFCPGLYRAPPPAETWVQAVAFVTIIVFSLIGYLSIIVIIKKNRRMHTPTNLFILNLAVASLTIVVVNTPFEFVSKVAPDAGFVGGLAGTILCKLVSFSQLCAFNAAILTLVLIAADRFIAVFFPLKRMINERRALWLVAVTWLAPALAGSILFRVNQVIEFRGKWFCIEVWGPPFAANAAKLYSILDFAIFYAVPLLEIVSLYAAIIYKIWMRQIPGQLTTANRRVELQAKKKVLKMLITAVLTFAFSWLPIKLIFMIKLLGQLKCFPSRELHYVSIFLPFSSCAVNPFIYLIFSQDFKDGFKAIFKNLSFCCCCKMNLSLPQIHSRSIDMTQATYCESATCISMENFRKVENS